MTALLTRCSQGAESNSGCHFSGLFDWEVRSSTVVSMIVGISAPTLHELPMGLGLHFVVQPSLQVRTHNASCGCPEDSQTRKTRPGFNLLWGMEMMNLRIISRVYSADYRTWLSSLAILRFMACFTSACPCTTLVHSTTFCALIWTFAIWYFLILLSLCSCLYNFCFLD